MNNVIEFKKDYPCWQCEECESTRFWLIKDNKVACSECEMIMDGLTWVHEDE